MNFPFYIAKRYFFAKKSHNAINIITIISVVGVAICSAALVIVLSVFNGFESLIQTMFSTIDPELKVLPATGKVFSVENDTIQKIYRMPEIEQVAETLEENILLKYEENQQPAVMKGVSPNYILVSGIDSMMYDGEFLLNVKDQPRAILGLGLQTLLSYNLDFVYPMTIYVIKRTGNVMINPEKAIKKKYINVSGIFRVEQSYDSRYMFVPLETAREVLDLNTEVSSLEIKVKAGTNISALQGKLKEMLGQGFIVKNRYEQNEAFYKIMKTEKWAIFFILLFILIIATFNVIGSLAMLVLEKKDDIATLQSMGSSKKVIKRIFYAEGWMISLFGSVTGLIFGAAVSWVQMRFGLLQLPGNGTFIIDAYPVLLKFSDVILILITVNIIGFISSAMPVHFMARKYKL